MPRLTSEADHRLIAELAALGVQVTPRQLEHFDVILTIFHDQGLPVLKYAGFGEAVNITLGLPIIRTSVDHGTAFEIAGKGIASHDAMVLAIESAVQLSKYKQ